MKKHFDELAIVFGWYHQIGSTSIENGVRTIRNFKIIRNLLGA